MSHGLVIHRIGRTDYALRLTIGAHFAIDQAVEGGIGALMLRLHTSTWKLDDILPAFRHMLVGGGASPIEAASALRRLRMNDLPSVRFACIRAAAAAAGDNKKKPKKQKGGEAGEFSQGAIYRAAYSIGIKPGEVDQLTVWEWECCVEGWNMANGGPGESGSAPTASEMTALLAKYGS